MKSPIEKFIDRKLDQISGAGDIFGRFLGMFGRNASKAVIGLGILLLFGVVIFIWSALQGMKKRK